MNEIEYTNNMLFSTNVDDTRIYPIIFEDFIKYKPDLEYYVFYDESKKTYNRLLT